MTKLKSSEENKKPSMKTIFLPKKASTLLLKKRLLLKLLELLPNSNMRRMKLSMMLKKKSCGMRERSANSK
jgi:hypothetical protein